MVTFPTVLKFGNALDFYKEWQPPTVIVSDGAHNLDNTTDLLDWYEPHIEQWSSHAKPETTLWFWCSELTFASLHPLLAEYDWCFRGVNVWDKGVTAAKTTPCAFPSVTEFCVHYVRDAEAAKFKPGFAPTNSWRDGPPRGAERLKNTRIRQKLARHMEILLQSSSDPGDVVWEPFGGLCDAGASAYTLGRVSFYAEADPDLFNLACKRINAMSEAESSLRSQRELFDLAMNGDD